jgi:tRNA A-37 threonylcarbamoyl transferase component Bud32
VSWKSYLFIDPKWKSFFECHNEDPIQAILNIDSRECITRGGGNEVSRLSITSAGGTEKSLFLKKYFTSTRSKRWKGFFRGTFLGRSKVRKEFKNLLLLRSLGLNTPDPVAWGEQRKGGWLLNSFLITSEIPKGTGLDFYLTSVLPRMSLKTAAKARSTLLKNLAETTAEMHRNGFEHHDFYWRNILLSDQDVTRFFLIDSPKGKSWPQWIMKRRFISDLATLDSPAPTVFRKTERMRFYLNYRNIKKLTSLDKKIIKRILSLSNQQRDRQIHRLPKLAPSER